MTPSRNRIGPVLGIAPLATLAFAADDLTPRPALLVFGYSLTAGDGVGDEYGFPARLQAFLM